MKEILEAGNQMAKRLEHILEYNGNLSIKGRSNIAHEVEAWDKAVKEHSSQAPTEPEVSE